MKDTAFSLSSSKGPVDIVNIDYIHSIVNHVLYSKKNDPYSGRGVDIGNLRYKSLSECMEYRGIIKENLDKYTDLICEDVDFMLVAGILILTISINYKNKSYKLAFNTKDNKVRSVI